VLVTGLQAGTTICIYGINGAMLLQQTVGTGYCKLNTANLTSGMYIVKAGTAVKKLVKQ
jgi:hypothetical protein